MSALSRSTRIEPSGRGPTAEALREGRFVVSNDYLADDSTALWHDEARRLGLRSLAAFPIPGKEGPRGCLSVGASVSGYFDDEIVGLLSGLAEDFGFALEVHDREADRRRAEEALRATAQRLVDAEKLGRTGSFHADFATGELNWSEGHFRLLGVEPGAFLPSSEALLARIHPEDRPKMDEISRAGWEGKPAGSHEYRVVDPSGAVRWLFATSELLTDSFGRLAAVFGAVRDVTEQKLAAERQRLWSHVLEGSADGVLVAGPDRRVLMVNRAFESMSGFASEEVVGRMPHFLEIGAAGPGSRPRHLDVAREERKVGRGGPEPAEVRRDVSRQPLDRGGEGRERHDDPLRGDVYRPVGARRREGEDRIPLPARPAHGLREPRRPRGGARPGARGRAGSTRRRSPSWSSTSTVSRPSTRRSGGRSETRPSAAAAGRLAAAVNARDILARVGPDEFGVCVRVPEGPVRLRGRRRKGPGRLREPVRGRRAGRSRSARASGSRSSPATGKTRGA